MFNKDFKQLKSNINDVFTDLFTMYCLLYIFSGIRQFGKKFKIIAEILGTKTESHVRKFFVDYKRRYNLDAVLKEYEADFGPHIWDDEV